MSNSNCILLRRSIDSDRALSVMRATPGLSLREAELFAARGMAGGLPSLKDIVNRPLKDQERGAKRLAQAIRNKEPMVVIADYDCDGATACAVMVAGLLALGAVIDYVVPDRMVHGYGISPSVVDLARDSYPRARILVTVDNGILGHSGISYAGQLGLDVIVTDHHLPGEVLPDAHAIINPSRQDCSSGLQSLAGVGVALWTVMATKNELAKQGEPSVALNFLLPYVALGTVADLVSLSAENRQLVAQGLLLLRSNKGPLGLEALIAESGLNPALLTTTDIGFALGPRINAAGRLETMELGIDLLLAQDKRQANKLAKLLTETNEMRKKMQKEASEQAHVTIEPVQESGKFSLVQADEQWHPGIIGLVASRLKETHHRPSFVFSLHNGMAKGSGRSIPGFHLKDALEEVARRDPSVLAHFGGHAMAAGAQLRSPEKVDRFKELFEAVASERIDAPMLEQTLMSDGEIPDMDEAHAARILRHPWGQGFEAPAFDSKAQIEHVQPLGKDGKHWRIRAQIQGHAAPTPMVLFNQPEPLKGQAHLYAQPSLNTWRGVTSVQWLGKVLAN